MALPATDNFNRSNSTSSLGSATWTVARGTFGINSNAAYPNQTSDESGAFWNADTFAADQYSEVTLAARSAGTWGGPAVRASAGSGGTYYGYYTDGTDGYLLKVVAGSWAEIGTTDSIAWTAGDRMRLEVEGTTLRVLRNGTQVRTATDSSISSGAAGISGYSGFTGTRLDDWEGGDLAGGGSVALAAALSGQGDIAAALTVTGAGSVALSAALSGQGDMAAALSVTGGGSVALASALSGTGGMAASLTVEEPGTAAPIVSPALGGPVEYYIRWKTAAGATRAIIAGATGAGRNGFLGLTYRKEVNRPGRFSLVLPFEHPALESFADKDQVEIWRRHPAAGIDWYRDFFGVFRNEDLAEQPDGRILATLSGPGALARLGWYHILWPAGTADRTVFTAAKAETIMKTLVTRNAVAASATAAAGRDRNAPDYGVSVQADAASGATVSWNCGQRRNLLAELQELQRIAGLDFDLVRTGANSWEFRTYAGQRGADKSATLVFARERGNLSGLRYTKHREREATVALVGGPGEGPLRRTRTRTGPGYSAANDIEAFVDARQATADAAGDAELDAAGDAALDAAAARDQFVASLLQTEGCRYGPAPGHFELGDLATVFYPRVGAVVQQISAIEVRYVVGQAEQVKGEFTTL